MLTPYVTKVVIAANETLPVSLLADARYLNNTIAVEIGTSGILSFRHKVLFGQWETPEAPNTIDVSTRKSIMFNGAALEALEITNTGSEEITLHIIRV
jgi:hypothetical protein